MSSSMRRFSVGLALALALFAAPVTSHAAWPALIQYSQALRQHGTTIFSDPALRAGTLKRIGPNLVAHPGGTSVVFSVSEASGKTWAVRCFTQKPPHNRHDAIARALTEGGLTAENGLFPEIEYVKEGIQLDIGGKAQWYPVVKMAWVDGKRFERHVHSLIDGGKHAALEQLAEDWRAVHNTLRSKNIAHGDLQHGNIIVGGNGKMKLVDLDDIFIESFRGERSGGAGHESYAHPTRRGRDFYLDVDNFSSMVIYVSLKALAHDPSLWHDPKIHGADREANGVLTPGGGHDNLIFRRADFDEPATAVVWKKLAKSPSMEVRKLAKQLEEYAGLHVSEVPPLEHVLAGAPWKPDGTVPAGFERVDIDVDVEHAAASQAPAAVPAAKVLKQPGPNATPAEWQMYRMKVMSGRK